jgi:hypothetical protein
MCLYEWQPRDLQVRICEKVRTEMRGGGTVHTPMAMERVRKQLKGNELQASMVQKSPEVVGNKGVEWRKGIPARAASRRGLTG